MPGGEPLADLRRDGQVAWLTLNRPHRLNAFTSELHAALAEAIGQVERDPPQVLVLTGRGRGFCSGQDIGERVAAITAGEPVDLGQSIDRNYNPLIRRMKALPFPVIAAVNGVAAGAGIGLALAADIVLAARSARFVLAFANIGLAPDAGVSWALPRIIGRVRASALLLTGGSISAEQAADWGLVWQVFDDGELIAAAGALASDLVRRSGESQAATKRLLTQPCDSLDQQLDRERDEQARLGHSAAYRAAVVAFAART